MTREEAIEVLKQDRQCEYDADLWDALGMAISALEQMDDATLKDIYCMGCDYEQQEHCVHWKQGKCNGYTEPCEKCEVGNPCLYCEHEFKEKQQPCEDTVSREAVLNTLDNMDKALDENRTVENYKALLKECYKQLPSATQKSGKWILLDECANSGYYCSRCQKKLVKEGWSETVKKIKYCPNCGEKMVEPQESEDKEGESE